MIKFSEDSAEHLFWSVLDSDLAKVRTFFRRTKKPYESFMDKRERHDGAIQAVLRGSMTTPMLKLLLQNGYDTSAKTASGINFYSAALYMRDLALAYQALECSEGTADWSIGYKFFEEDEEFVDADEELDRIEDEHRALQLLRKSKLPTEKAVTLLKELGHSFVGLVSSRAVSTAEDVILLASSKTRGSLRL